MGVLYKVMASNESLSGLSDRHLLEETLRLSRQERHATAQLLGALAEVDARRLYLAQGYSSLFAYCTRCLHLSEHAALNRIEAARAARAFPIIVDRIAECALTLTAVRLLRPILTRDNYRAVIDSARHKTTKEVELLVASLKPKPVVPSTIRKLPSVQGEFKPAEVPAAHSAPAQPPRSLPPAPPSRRPLAKPLSAESYRLQITMSRATHDKLRKAQALMRHRIPSGDPAEIFDRALDALLNAVEKSKWARVDHPRQARPKGGDTRHIPSSVKREVWKRDESRCAFAGSDGRCSETSFLEFHHVVPYARGGKATSENIELRCRAHNAHEAGKEFGLFAKEGRPGYDARPA